MLKLFSAALVLVSMVSVAHAQDRRNDDGHAPAVSNEKVAWADVLRVDPVYENVSSVRPREECYEANVDRRDTRGNNAAGTVLGAIVGGALGNTVGKGDGRKAATVAGAVIGGAVGNNASSRDDRYYNSTETRCQMVDERYDERRLTGYEVQYRYRGDVYISHLDYDPGERIRVRVSVVPAE